MLASDKAEISENQSNNDSMYLEFAKLQTLLAQNNKEQALEMLNSIKTEQDKSTELAEAIAELSNMLEKMRTDDSISSVNADWENICKSNGINLKYKLSKNDVEILLVDLKKILDQTGSKIKEKLIFVQNYIGQ
ncbi:MAG: hypothetical protein J5934_05895, partial [Succinivibrio sp.]|nr:hypothetical protein [Succinivibrio sp.]